MLKRITKHFWVLFFFLFFLFGQKTTFASDPPNLLSPANNSQTSDTSPKLSWEYSGTCIESGSCFRVEVDNSTDFSSPDKTTYTDSKSYSPKLSSGDWYWRVKTKDTSGTWSNWSTVYKFSIGQPTFTPTPSSIQTNLKESSKPKSENNFSISNIPSEINSEEEFEISVLLKISNSPNQDFFLKAAFKKEGGSNYFGETFVSGTWVKNNSTFSKQLKIKTDSGGQWEGKIELKPDSEDSGFEGTNNYILKVARYSDSGSGPTWSNEQTLKINEAFKPSPSPLDESEETKVATEEADLTASIIKPSPKSYEIKIASVAGEAVISNNTKLESEAQVLEVKQVNWFLIILGLGILAGGSGYIFIKLKKEKIHVKSFN